MIEIYTDGACSGNPGPGGWAWRAYGEVAQTGWGSDPMTTNQRMEMLAVVDALETVTRRPVLVCSDSAYVVNCFEKGWWLKWQTTGWWNAKNQPVANRDLWEQLIVLVNAGGVGLLKVKGHSGDPRNDFVDALAVSAKRKQSEGSNMNVADEAPAPAPNRSGEPLYWSADDDGFFHDPAVHGGPPIPAQVRYDRDAHGPRKIELVLGSHTSLRLNRGMARWLGLRLIEAAAVAESIGGNSLPVGRIGTTRGHEARFDQIDGLEATKGE